MRTLPHVLALVALVGNNTVGVAAEVSETGDRALSRDLGVLSLEQLMEIEVPTVYGASRHVQKVTLAPASVSIVTSDEIRKQGFRTIAEALNSLPGVYVSNDRNFQYLGVRGFLRPGDYNSRVLLLVDGHRMNDNLYDAIYVGTEATLDIDLIDRIEFIPGPSSSIYGNNAFLGVINIKTRRGAQIDGIEASVEGGSLDTYSGRLSFGKKFKNDLEVLVSASWYESAGDRNLYFPEFDDPTTNDGIARNSDDESASRFLGSLTYHDLTLSGAFSIREKKVPTASFGTIFNDGRLETRDERAYVDLKYEGAITDDSQLLARIYYDRYVYDGTYPYGDGEPIPAVTLNVDEAVGDWVGAEVQYNHTLFDVHTAIVGADYRENLRQFQRNYDKGSPDDYLYADHTSRQMGIFGQGEIALLPNLQLNAGVRYDHYSAFGGTVNPRAGLIYNPWEPTTFKLLYGRAFRAPNEFELHYYSAENFKDNPNLQPETIDTYELVWEQKFGKRHGIRVSGYRYDIEGLISQVHDPADDRLYFDNVDRAQATGLEISWEGRFDHGITARSSYSLQRTEDAAGEELSNSPRHLAKLNVTVPIYREKVFGGLELQYHGEAQTLRGQAADDFFIANLTLFSRELLKGLEFSASIYNLLDTSYSYPGSEDHLQDTLAQDGRSFRLKLTYRY